VAGFILEMRREGRGKLFLLFRKSSSILYFPVLSAIRYFLGNSVTKISVTVAKMH